MRNVYPSSLLQSVIACISQHIGVRELVLLKLLCPQAAKKPVKNIMLIFYLLHFIQKIPIIGIKENLCSHIVWFPHLRWISSFDRMFSLFSVQHFYTGLNQGRSHLFACMEVWMSEWPVAIVSPRAPRAFCPALSEGRCTMVPLPIHLLTRH